MFFFFFVGGLNADENSMEINLKRLKIAVSNFKKAKNKDEKGVWCDKVVKIQYLLFKKSQEEKYKNAFLKTLKTCQQLPIAEANLKFHQKLEKDFLLKNNSVNNAPIEANEVSPTLTSETPQIKSAEKASWIIGLNYYSWFDRFYIINGATKTELISPVAAMAFSISREKWGKKFGSFYSLGFLGGKVTFGSENGNYFQDNVSISGLMAKASMLGGRMEKAHFALSIPLFIGKGDYSTAPGLSYEGDSKKLFGLMFETIFKNGNWGIDLGFGKWVGEKYFLWSGGLSYQF